MKLYTYWRSSSAYRVRIALAFKGVAHEPVFVDLLRAGGEQHSAEFRAKNALAQVPVLELDDGSLICQSLAIIEYLEERYPLPPLLPGDALERAQVRELSALVAAGIQPFQNLATLNFLASEAPGLPRARWLRHFIGLGMVALEQRAAQTSRGFLVGAQPTMADALLVPQLYVARRFDVDVSACPRLLSIEARCLALEPFARAHPDNQPDRPTEGRARA
jgi:maleylacetoacetate isomerase